MPLRKRHDRRRQGLRPLEKVELTLGPHPRRAQFPNDDARLRAWEVYRDEVMESPSPGRRPWAWWKFEEHIDPPTDQRAYLQEHELLTLDEELELASQDEDIADARDPGFDDE
jgi:hypothetical protein